MGYVELKQKHQAEVNDFPMVFAFSNEQFAEAMAKLGLQEDDLDKVYKFGDTGGIYRREDAERLHSMFRRHDAEMAEAMQEPAFALEAFDYELSNHEFCITGSVEDTLAALGLSDADIDANSVLKEALQKAVEHQKEVRV